MHPVPLTVIPDPGLTRSTLLRAGRGTVVLTGDFDGPICTCGGCGAPLIEGVRSDHVVDLVLTCNACGACNDVPVTSVRDIDPATIEKPVVFPAGRYELTEAITVHERWVLASERALQGSSTFVPVRYYP